MGDQHPPKTGAWSTSQATRRKTIESKGKQNSKNAVIVRWKKWCLNRKERGTGATHLRREQDVRKARQDVAYADHGVQVRHEVGFGGGDEDCFPK